MQKWERDVGKKWQRETEVDKQISHLQQIPKERNPTEHCGRSNSGIYTESWPI